KLAYKSETRRGDSVKEEEKERGQTSQRKLKNSPVVSDQGSDTVSAAVDGAREDSNHWYRSPVDSVDRMPWQSEATGLPKKRLQMTPVDWSS
ncbi:MAG: hypothetical protein Q9203_005402, partial [Teloschistes exilis]